MVEGQLHANIRSERKTYFVPFTTGAPSCSKQFAPCLVEGPSVLVIEHEEETA